MIILLYRKEKLGDIGQREIRLEITEKLIDESFY